MKFKGVIFDLDGTLLNTLKDLADSVNYALEQYGLPTHETDAYRTMVGNGFANLIERAVGVSLLKVQTVNFGANDDVLPSGRMTETEKTALVKGVYEAFTDEYSRRYLRSTAPYPGVLAMVSHLSDAGMKLGVNSNKRDDYTKDLIRRHFPDAEWTEVLGGKEDMPKKPDPAGAHFIAEKMGIHAKKNGAESSAALVGERRISDGGAGAVFGDPAFEEENGGRKKGIFSGIASIFKKNKDDDGNNRYSEIAYVGDSNVDIVTAKNAGMTAVGVAWGFRGRKELAEAGADFIAEDPVTLEEYLLKK